MIYSSNLCTEIAQNMSEVKQVSRVYSDRGLAMKLSSQQQNQVIMLYVTWLHYVR